MEFSTSIKLTAATAAAASGTSGSSNELGNLFRITQKVGEDDGVESFNLSVSSSLEEGADLFRRNIGLQKNTKITRQKAEMNGRSMHH